MTAPISPDRLVRHCDPAAFPFETTADLPPLDEMVGQDRAVEAVAFGVAIRQPGFNLFAMGPEGIGKLSLLRQVLETRAAGEPAPEDWCYVHNFDDPRRPRAIRLPAGEGRRFRDRIAQLEREFQAAIPAAFESDEYRNRREALEAALKERREAALMDFERLAAGKGLALLRTPVGVGLAPLHDGKVLDRDQVAALPEEERRRLAEASGELEAKLGDLIQRQFPAWERETRTAIRKTGQDVARRAVGHLIDEVRAGDADHDEIVEHLAALEADVVANAEEFLAAAQPRELPSLLAARLEDGALFRRYGVNLLIDHADSSGAPVVFEDLPTQPNLLGRVEHTAHLGALVTDYTLIRPGALHRANGGYLVLDARRLLTQPFAWEELKRALRAGEIRIESLGDRLGLSTVSIEPEAIPLEVKVVLTGDRRIHDRPRARPGLPRALQGHRRLRRGLRADARRRGRVRPAPGGHRPAGAAEEPRRSRGGEGHRTRRPHRRRRWEGFSPTRARSPTCSGSSNYWAEKAHHELIGASDVDHAIAAQERRLD